MFVVTVSALTEAQAGRGMRIGTYDFAHVNYVQAGVDSMNKTIAYLGRVAPKYAGTSNAASSETPGILCRPN